MFCSLGLSLSVLLRVPELLKFLLPLPQQGQVCQSLRAVILSTAQDDGFGVTPSVVDGAVSMCGRSPWGIGLGIGMPPTLALNLPASPRQK